MCVQYGRRLWALRKAASLTQSRLGELAGVARVHISRLECDVPSRSTAATRRNLARAYGVPAHVLDSYLEGELELREVVAHWSAPRVPTVSNQTCACSGRRPVENVGLRTRARCSQCGGWTWRRVDEPDARTRLALDEDEINGEADLDLRIETRFRRERIEGGAHIPLGECNGDAIYHQGGE
jgi:transcriptional regulator with XRE-family HTH domain